jgi:hypothetical protein
MKFAWFTPFSVAVLVTGVFAQTPPPARIVGSITAINASAHQVTVKSLTGETAELAILPLSHILHLPPGETDMKKAETLTIGDLTVGEELVATYQPSADQKTKEARTLLVRTKADLEELAKKDDEDWRKRGVTGNLTAMDAAAKSFTVKAGSKELTVKPEEKTEYLRYSPDSARSTDAKPSSFAELKAGDEVHVLGNKNAEGTEIAAEKVVFGFFPQIAATIKSVNAAGNEMVVTDLATKKPVTIRVIPDSIMKKLPDIAAQALARRYGAGRGGGGDAAGGGRGAGRGPGPGGPGGPGGGHGGDVSQMLDHAPAITLADLKPGDAIMVKTTTGSGSRPGTAVMLIAGVEPILTAAPNSTRDIMSGWNLGGGGGEGN